MRCRRRQPRVQPLSPPMWVAVGCGLHTAMAVFSHAAAGPLLLFPFDWPLRFHSPLSCWNAGYHAGLVALLEHLAALAMVVSFGLARLAQRRSAPRRTNP